MAQEDVQNGAEKSAVAFTAVKPQLFVEAPKANEAVQFYKAAFGAVEVGRSLHPKRKADQELPLVLAVQLKLGDSTILVSDLADDSPAPEKKTVGRGCLLCLETEDFDAAIAKALSAGAVAEIDNVEADGACCGGGRTSKVKDPYGFVWLICTPEKKCTTVEA